MGKINVTIRYADGGHRSFKVRDKKPKTKEAPKIRYNWNSLPNEIKFMIFDYLFEQHPTTEYPSELAAFTLPDILEAERRFFKTNKTMKMSKIDYWNDLDQKSLQKIKHLTIALEDWYPETVLALSEVPLHEKNNLHSIVLDLSAVSRLSTLNWYDPSDFRISEILYKMMCDLVKASRGCVDKVAVLFPLGSDIVIRNTGEFIERELQVKISRTGQKDIVLANGRQAIVCFWYAQVTPDFATHRWVDWF